MEKIKNMFFKNTYVEVFLALILFVIALKMDNIVDMVIYLLYFIIMLEIVSAVLSFIRDRRVKIRFLIDAFLILTLREFIVNVVKINNEQMDGGIKVLLESSINVHLLVFSGVLLFLFFLRWLAALTSPDNH